MNASFHFCLFFFFNPLCCEYPDISTHFSSFQVRHFKISSLKLRIAHTQVYISLLYKVTHELFMRNKVHFYSGSAALCLICIPAASLKKRSITLGAVQGNGQLFCSPCTAQRRGCHHRPLPSIDFRARRWCQRCLHPPDGHRGDGV